MQPFKKTSYKLLLLLPMVGMCSFVVLYIVAASQYPGGSHVQSSHIGFSIQYNYLCDLLDRYAINGDRNAASKTARIALGFLCTGILVLWYLLPKLFKTTIINNWIIRLSGMASMLTLVFLASEIHDNIVRIAGVFGVIALIATFIELRRSRFYTLLILGIGCFCLVLINFYIYESGYAIRKLAIIQKITFISCISWFMSLNVLLYKSYLQHN